MNSYGRKEEGFFVFSTEGKIMKELDPKIPSIPEAPESENDTSKEERRGKINRVSVTIQTSTDSTTENETDCSESSEHVSIDKTAFCERTIDTFVSSNSKSKKKKITEPNYRNETSCRIINDGAVDGKLSYRDKNSKDDSRYGLCDENDDEKGNSTSVWTFQRKMIVDKNEDISLKSAKQSALNSVLRNSISKEGQGERYLISNRSNTDTLKPHEMPELYGDSDCTTFSDKIKETGRTEGKKVLKRRRGRREPTNTNENSSNVIGYLRSLDYSDFRELANSVNLRDKETLRKQNKLWSNSVRISKCARNCSGQRKNSKMYSNNRKIASAKRMLNANTDTESCLTEGDRFDIIHSVEYKFERSMSASKKEKYRKPAPVFLCDAGNDPKILLMSVQSTQTSEHVVNKGTIACVNIKSRCMQTSKESTLVDERLNSKEIATNTECLGKCGETMLASTVSERKKVMLVRNEEMKHDLTAESAELKTSANKKKKKIKIKKNVSKRFKKSRKLFLNLLSCYRKQQNKLEDFEKKDNIMTMESSHISNGIKSPSHLKSAHDQYFEVVNAAIASNEKPLNQPRMEKELKERTSLQSLAETIHASLTHMKNSERSPLVEANLALRTLTEGSNIPPTVQGNQSIESNCISSWINGDKSFHLSTGTSEVALKTSRIKSTGYLDSLSMFSLKTRSVELIQGSSKLTQHTSEILLNKNCIPFSENNSKEMSQKTKKNECIMSELTDNIRKWDLLTFSSQPISLQTKRKCTRKRRERSKDNPDISSISKQGPGSSLASGKSSKSGKIKNRSNTTPKRASRKSPMVPRRVSVEVKRKPFKMTPIASVSFVSLQSQSKPSSANDKKLSKRTLGKVRKTRSIRSDPFCAKIISKSRTKTKSGQNSKIDLKCNSNKPSKILFKPKKTRTSVFGFTAPCAPKGSQSKTSTEMRYSKGVKPAKRGTSPVTSHKSYTSYEEDGRTFSRNQDPSLIVSDTSAPFMCTSESTSLTLKSGERSQTANMRQKKNTKALSSTFGRKTQAPRSYSNTMESNSLEGSSTRTWNANVQSDMAKRRRILKKFQRISQDVKPRSLKKLSSALSKNAGSRCSSATSRNSYTTSSTHSITKTALIENSSSVTLQSSQRDIWTRLSRPKARRSGSRVCPIPNRLDEIENWLLHT